MLDEIAFFFFIFCVLFYFMVLALSVLGSKPSKRNVINLIYKNWVKNRLKDDTPLTAVQALRNFIMGSSTFVSALFILLGILVGFYQTIFADTTPFLGMRDYSVGLIQITLNLIIIIFCLFNFILAVRYATRLSLLIGGNPQEYSIGKIKGISVTRKTFISAQNHWMFGIRGLFYLVATILWILNTIFFIIATIFVTIYLIVFQDIWIFSRRK